MTTELDALVVSLKADTRQFEGGLAAARSALDDLGAMARLPQTALADTLAAVRETGSGLSEAMRSTFDGMTGLIDRFARTGRLSFEDLRSTALSVLNDIASSALRSLLADGGGDGLFASLFASLGSIFGRATGGPVTPAQPYIVGERGPELFVPRNAGEILPNGRGGFGGSRPISITINVAATGGNEQGRESATQIALAVRRALGRAERFS
ncbi:MAG: hypothetical protein Kow00104_13570 [Rhodothalassiaceae bacterium]